MKKIKVLVADDIEIARSGYQILFSKSNDIEICGTACNGTEVLKMNDELKPDVILMDIMMPEKDGIQTCKELFFKNENTKVILNTSHVQEDVINRVLASGAKGLLLKDADHSEIEKAIITVNSGADYYNKFVVDTLIRKLLKGNPESLKEYWEKQFSSREIDIIQLTSKGLTSAEIGKSLHLSKRTVEVTRSAILKKMNVRNIVEMIIHSYKIGLLDMDKQVVS